MDEQEEGNKDGTKRLLSNENNRSPIKTPFIELEDDTDGDALAAYKLKIGCMNDGGPIKLHSVTKPAAPPQKKTMKIEPIVPTMKFYLGGGGDGSKSGNNQDKN